MKHIEISPKDLIFTRWSEFESFSDLEQTSDRAYWKKLPPIVVLKHPKKEAYLIYNGNHRAMVAKSKGLKVKAFLVETEEDLSKIPLNESMYYAHPEYYQKYDTAVERLIQKNEIFQKIQNDKMAENRHLPETAVLLQTKAHTVIRDSIGLLEENACKKILDLSCGIGENMVFLSKKGFMVYGLDTSDIRLSIVKNKIRKHNLVGAHVKKGNMRQILFNDSEFDAVIASAGIFQQTMEQAKKTIIEANRVLRKDGLFILQVLSKNVPNYGKGIMVEKDTFISFDSLRGNVPCHYFSKEEIEKELAPLFKVIKIYPEYTHKGQVKDVPMKWNIISKKE